MTRPDPAEVRARLEHARLMEGIDRRRQRRGFHVPPHLEGEYQRLIHHYRYRSHEAATMLGITHRPAR